MREIRGFYLIVLLALLNAGIIFLIGCKKEKTPEYGVVTDIDGNSYKTVKVGEHWWMAENLRTTRLNDSTEIPNVTAYNIWGTLSTPGYCWYNNDIDNKAVYGGLYNFYAVRTGKLCPTGWHISGEWKELVEFLGGHWKSLGNLPHTLKSDSIGGKLKEAGTTHWAEPNTGATNESGFTAIPGGYRSRDIFSSLGKFGYWWTPSDIKGEPDLPRFNYTFSLGFDRMDATIGHQYQDSNGFYFTGLSVRCVMD